MNNTPITDALRAHLATHSGDLDAVVDALARIEEKVSERDRELANAVPVAY